MADELSDDKKYPRFLRTVPTESNQAKAMTAIIKAMGWTYVSVVHSGMGSCSLYNLEDTVL